MIELLGIALLFVVIVFGRRWQFELGRRRRRNFYREYLQSEAWQRKRALVLRRDNWRCRRCGGKATQVHHLRYAKYNIGKEPIDWLVSLCRPCHEAQHADRLY